MSFAQMVKKSINNSINNSKTDNVIVNEVVPHKDEINFPSLLKEAPKSNIDIKLNTPVKQTKKYKMSDATYQKKLEKKAIKKADKELELEQKETENLQKQKEFEKKVIKYAKKAYDDEYTIAFIEEKRKAEAIKRAKVAYDKAYNSEYEALSNAQKAYDKVFSSTNNEFAAKKSFDKTYKNTHELLRKNKYVVQKEEIQNTEELIEEPQLLDDDSDEDLPTLKQPTFTEEKIMDVFQMNNTNDVFQMNNTNDEFQMNNTNDEFQMNNTNNGFQMNNTNNGFQIFNKKKILSKQNLFNKKVEATKNEYINNILSEQLLTEIKENIKQNKTFTLDLKTTDDILYSGDDYIITKSGFLKNKTFPKYFSSVIYKKLNLKLYVDIKRSDEKTFNLLLTDKSILTKY